HPSHPSDVPRCHQAKELSHTWQMSKHAMRRPCRYSTSLRVLQAAFSRFAFPFVPNPQRLHNRGVGVFITHLRKGPRAMFERRGEGGTLEQRRGL
ncbi:hypothetical protein EI94DRAFT_1720446, partial [Lactarius quietus]